VLFNEAQRRQVLNQTAVQLGLGIEVELLEPPLGRQAGKAATAGEPALLGGTNLGRQQLFQEDRVAQLLLARAVEVLGQRFGGGVQLEVGKVVAQLLVDSRGRHRHAPAASA
jgi:hypothetical protein